MTDTLGVYIPGRWLWDREGSCLYCSKPVLARRLCSKHYNQWWRHGMVDIEPKPVVGVAPCEQSDLDFLTYDKQGVPHSITVKVGQKHANWFRKQLALCARCTIQEECLELADRYNMAIGIWGGKLPHERGWTK